MGKFIYSFILATLVMSYTATFGQAMTKVPKACDMTDEAQDRLNQSAVPIDAQYKKAITWRETVPKKFHAVLGFIQIVTVAPCHLSDSKNASVTIRALRLIEHDPQTGVERIVSNIDRFSAKDNPASFEGKLFQRLPRWYPSSGKIIRPGKNIIQYADNQIVIDVSKKPQTIYHGWTNPKVKAKPGMNYLVEMEVNIVGAARLQMGIDFWKSIDSKGSDFDETCKKSTNCQGSLSNWFGPTNGFQTIRMATF